MSVAALYTTWHRARYSASSVFFKNYGADFVIGIQL